MQSVLRLLKGGIVLFGPAMSPFCPFRNKFGPQFGHSVILSLGKLRIQADRDAVIHRERVFPFVLFRLPRRTTKRIDKANIPVKQSDRTDIFGPLPTSARQFVLHSQGLFVHAVWHAREYITES